MKAYILLLLFELFLNYDTEAALNYAKEYCDRPYPIYSKLDPNKGTSAMFASRVIHAGKFSVMVCHEWADEDRFIPSSYGLMRCLSRHGWKSSKKFPKNFKPGYPLFFADGYSMIAGTVNGKDDIRVYAHSPYTCNEYVDLENEEVVYYYLDED